MPDKSNTDTRQRSRARKGAPGIVEVSLRAGVSTATVSRYFNNPDVVRPMTRQRIEKAARELGYIRDRVAGAMHGMMSGSIGLIVPTVDNAIFSELIEAFSLRLHEHDRTMLIASHNYDLEREVGIVRSLLERRIDAVALVGRDHPEAALEMLRLRGVPTITLWNAEGVAGIPSIGTDNRQCAIDVTQHLIHLQHRRIALLFPDTRFNDRARDRFDGVMHCLNSADITVPDHWQRSCPYDTDAAKSVAMEILQEDIPSAFICGNDVIAHGVIHAASRLGIRIPQQVSVVGIGDFRGSSAIEPPLTTVRLPARRIGQIAADTLIDRQLLKNIRELPDQRLSTELIVRESTAAAPA